MLDAFMVPTTYVPLFGAVQYGDVATVQEYLHNGVDPNACCTPDGSLLASAKKYKQREVVNILVRAGAKR